MRARYDAAQTTEDNRRHWSNADAMSADASANPQVRRTIRNRARYEYANNCYLYGTANTLANDTIGSGPRLQMLSDDTAFNEIVERLWVEWCNAVDFDSKLRVMRVGRVISGEAFAVKSRNRGVRHPVPMDVFVYEPDQIGGPMASAADPYYYDGVRYDEAGNPVTYDVYKAHPGDVLNPFMLPTDYDTISADKVWHYYRADRPGQRRGVPECTASLPLFAHLRNLDLSVVQAMRTAADYAMAIQTTASFDENDTGAGSGGTQGDGGTSSGASPMDTFELQRGMTTVLPDGYTLAQTKPEQPHQKYNEVADGLVRQIGRAMNVPFEIIAMDAGKANMSAAYLGRQPYIKAIEVERKVLERFCDWTVCDWLYYLERADIPELADYRGRFPTTRHTWFWDEFVNHADPDKVASAEQTSLATGATTLPLIHAKKGRDAETILIQEAKFYRIPVEELRKKKFEKQYMAAQAAPVRPDPELDPEDMDEESQGGGDGRESSG
jgi:capsid protein